jgi:hypothetical protein
LVAGGLYASVLMLQAMPRLDESVFSISRPVSEQYGTKALEAADPSPQAV